MPSNLTIASSDSAHNLDVIFDTSRMSDYISSVSKSCFLPIRDLRRNQNTIDSTTTQTVATSLIHNATLSFSSIYPYFTCSQLFTLAKN